MVLVLACIAGIVAYVQFFRPTDPPTPAMEPMQVQQQVQQQVSAQVPISEHTSAERHQISREVSAKRPEQSSQPVATVEIRDIFEPPPIPPRLKQKLKVRAHRRAAPPKAAPVYIPMELTGTIIGGNKPMAIINQKFIPLGETIEGFRVIRITANEVVLKTGSRRRILKVLESEEN